MKNLMSPKFERKNKLRNKPSNNGRLLFEAWFQCKFPLYRNPKEFFFMPFIMLSSFLKKHWDNNLFSSISEIDYYFFIKKSGKRLIFIL